MMRVMRAMMQVLPWPALAIIFWDAVGVSGVALVACVAALVYSTPRTE